MLESCHVGLPPISVSVRENYYRKELGTPESGARKRIQPLTPEVVQAHSFTVES